MSSSFSRFAAIGIVSGILVVLGMWLSGAYNSLVVLDESVNKAFSDIDIQYQRRMDLIPNIVRTVQGAANFEQSTLQAVTEARTNYMSAATQSGKVAAAGEFDSALARLLVTVEAYPQLTATQGFRDLTVALEGTENRIGYARTTYNETATTYNIEVRKFPRKLLAALFDFEARKELIEAKSGAENAPVVEFGSNIE